MRSAAFAFLFFLNVSVGFSQVRDATELLEEQITDGQDTSTHSYSYTLDSTVVKVRDFQSEKLGDLKQDPELNYKEPPTIAENLWDRFVRFLIDLLTSIMDKAFNTSWGNVIVYLIGIALLVVIIMMLLKVNAFKMFGRSASSASLSHEVLDEDINEMDFEALLQDAVNKKDYRRGVRLFFLYALKLLSDKHIIQWESGKTNHEYVSEVKEKELRKGLDDLSFYFDYAWYGNFNISEETFAKVQSTFADWKQRVK